MGDLYLCPCFAFKSVPNPYGRKAATGFGHKTRYETPKEGADLISSAPRSSFSPNEKPEEPRIAKRKVEFTFGKSEANIY